MSDDWTILACGDPARGDDGLADAAVNRLTAASRAHARVRRVRQLEAEDLIDALAAGPCLIVDAVRGVEPGQVVEFHLRRLLSASSGPVPASSHALPVETAVRLAAALGANVDRGTFIGIGGEAYELGTGLSTDAARGVDPAARAIERWIGKRRRARCA
jgi:hydrogenase maturation protease